MKQVKGDDFINCIFRIRELRQAKGITQAQLATQLDLKSASAVGMWEIGSRNPPSTILPRLAQALGCTIDELYGRGKDGA